MILDDHSRHRAWRGWGTTGGLAFAALAVAAVTGVGLAIPFDVRRPLESVGLLLLTNPGARIFRNLHYWSAQLFLVLTLAHAWRHVARPSDRRLSRGVWARATLSLPLAAFLMLSGFILKGDAEGMQALRILSTTVARLPLAGPFLSSLLFGPDPSSLQVLYVHHVATATVLTWLLVVEHARSVWPRLPSLVAVAGISSVAAWLATPTVHDGLAPLLKGPWYFVGLQEILHSATRPILVTGAALSILALLAALPRLPILAARRARIGLAILMVAYAGVTLFALSFRGENWALVPFVSPWTGLSLESPLRVPPIGVLRGRAIPTVLGRPEGCLVCHAQTTGLSASHRPDAVGCASCHAGNPFSLDKSVAHRGLILIPGNLATAARTCGTSACHPSAVERVGRSIMTTMRGVIEVDRAAFGRPGAEDARPSPSTLRSSAADTHLRQLCVSCHLGAEKRELGSVQQTSRGGGCNACHLTYSPAATASLAAYARSTRGGGASAGVTPLVHPDLSIRTTDNHCFGCHSRSGRISTSYEGWHEAEPGSAAPPGARTLLDGRVFVRATPDVHFEKGLLCVDCHTAREVMGDGTEHARKAGQLTVSCEDCHSAQPTIETHDRLPAESQRILALKGRLAPAAAILVTSKARDPLLATLIDERGQWRLIASRSGARLELKAPSPACGRTGAHSRLGCASCHASWAPRCSGCHTSFDPRAAAFDHAAQARVTGAWTETGRDYRAEAPTLGVRVAGASSGPRAGTIDTFIPGMVITIDRNRAVGKPPDIVFRRSYARAFSHTVSARSRSCVSCHNDPVALGYGRGVLAYAHAPAGGRWTFTPSAPASPFDGLPADAWLGFLERAPASRSMQPGVRPFDPDEQRRILTVGACLTCHAPDSRPMHDGVADFRSVLGRVSPKCVLPRWEGR